MGHSFSQIIIDNIIHYELLLFIYNYVVDIKKDQVILLSCENLCEILWKYPFNCLHWNYHFIENT